MVLPARGRALEGDRRADLEVEVLADLGEQVVERLAQAVGEDERADDERHADEDRDRDRDQPPEARPDALARDQRSRFDTHWAWSRQALHPVEHLLGRRARRLVDDASVAEEHDPVGVRGGDRIVGDHDDRLLVLVDGVAHEVEDLGAGVRVEVSGRLVGEDDLGLARQGAGHRDPLLLPAGELARAVLQPVVETDRRDDLVDPRLVAGLAAEHQREEDVLPGVERGDQVVRLEDEADLGPAQLGQVLVVELGEVGVADVHGAGRERVEPGEAVHQGALPRTRRTHDRGVPAGLEGDGDPVEGADLALADAVDLDGVDGSGRGPGTWRGGNDGCVARPCLCCSPGAPIRGTANPGRAGRLISP